MKFVDKRSLNPRVVYATDHSKAMVPVLFLFCVAMWVILRGTSCLVFMQSDYRVTDEAFSAETSKYVPSTFLRMCSLLLKERTFEFLFAFIAAGVVQCGGRKRSPRTSTIVQFIFHFWSFEISEHILRNQNLIIGLDLYSRQRFIYLDPILIYISVFESTAYMKFTKLQHVFL